MTNRFQLPAAYDRAEFEKMLEPSFTFSVEQLAPENRTYYDTFDWRLYRKSLTLHRGAGRLVLNPLSDDNRGSVVTFDEEPRFAADLPDGMLRDRLLKVVRVRALMRLADVQLQSHVYRILNRDEKTVARLAYTQATWPDASSEPGATIVTVRPVRGYRKHGRRLEELLSEHEEGSTDDSPVFFGALRAAGRSPGDYNSKLDVALQPGIPALVAERVILRRLCDTMRANEAGIKADIDTEFLHDYRIAVRRTRSALSQFKQVLPPDETESYKRRFRQLFRRTNLLRDLDVYLLAEAEYRAMLPEAMRDDIDPLFDYLRSQRALAHREVVTTLESADYGRLMYDWQSFIGSSLESERSESGGANADVPAVELADRRIRRRFRRIVQYGMSNLENTEDEPLHVLRLECKTLRYLLEFFAALYPPKRVARLIRQLKRLQDNLGEFVDLSVQQAHLLSTVDELPVVDSQTRRALMATGVLVETMSRRQRAVKDDFADTFRRFASRENRQEYKRLFGGSAKRDDS